MTVTERKQLDKQVLILTSGTLGLGSLISDQEAAAYLARAKRVFDKKSASFHIALAAEDVVEYAVATGMITCEEDFAN